MRAEVGDELAREAATMVLTDDNFATIAAAVEAGRRVYDNVRKFICYIFTHAVPEVMPFLIFALVGGAVPLPLTVMQILAIDLGTDTLPALALSREPAEPGLMDRPPRPRRQGVISAGMLARAWGFLGVISAALVMAGFFVTLRHAGGPWSAGGPGVRVSNGPCCRATTGPAASLGDLRPRAGSAGCCWRRRSDLQPAEAGPTALSFQPAGNEAMERSIMGNKQVIRMKAVVRDVMSTRPVWVSETASFREMAAKLREFRVGAFPVLDADGKVAGVVSEADMLAKEAVEDERGMRGMIAGIVHHAEQAKAEGVTAADLMTSPALTVSPDDTVEHAARIMYTRKVKRLPVVDADGRLAGIIGRADVLAVFDRTDAEIREEIMRDVIQGRSEPSWYSVIVHDGVVTLEGAPETAAIGRDLVSRARHLQGVVAVRDRLVCQDPPVPSTPGPWF